MIMALLFYLKMHLGGAHNTLTHIKALAQPPYYYIYIIYLNVLPYTLVFNMFLSYETKP